MKDYIGISASRMLHTLSVARMCYSIAKEMDEPEEFCKCAFMAGYLHDVGYEFSEVSDEHAEQSARLLEYIGMNNEVSEAIRTHGHPNIREEKKTKIWFILNLADMIVGPNGNTVSMEERCEGIKQRFGELSNQYIDACKIKDILEKWMER